MNLRSRIASVAIAILLPTQPNAEIIEDIKTDWYLISGQSLEEISDNLSKKGSNGFGGLATWRIHWTADCEVTLEAEGLLLKLVGSNKLNESEENTVDRARIALEGHELHHVQIARYAAEEILRNNCVDAEAIGKYWREKNREFDIRTNHGKSYGVIFE